MTGPQDDEPKVPQAACFCDHTMDEHVPPDMESRKFPCQACDCEDFDSDFPFIN